VSYALRGDFEKASKIQDQLRIPKVGSYLSSAIMALIDLSCGRRGEAYNWIQKAVKEHDPNLFTMATDPGWSAMSGLQECQSALREIGLAGWRRNDFELGANS
jgi:hypothetical protein